VIPFAAAFVGGALALHLLPELPQWPWPALALLALTLLWHRFTRALAGLFLGFVLAGLHGQAWVERAVPESLTGTEVTLTGTILGIPDHSSRRTRFLLQVDGIVAAPEGFRARRLRVTLFPADARLAAGDSIRATLRLRPPRGLHNAAGFDYGAWLYRQGIHGLASVRGGVERIETSRGRVWRGELDRLRTGVRDAMSEAHPGARHPGVMQALVIGERGAMDPEEWRRFLHTGTNHLMAISGLHVGLVAGFALLLARGGWRRIPWLRRALPLRWYGALAAMTAAAAYAALAGFSIPTQRALIMLILVSVAVLAQRDPLSWRIFAAALVLVLAAAPPSVLAAGFWFSFGAVAVILILLQGRVERPGAQTWLRLQAILAVALLPLSVAWFQLGSGIAPVANLIAVPVVSFLVLPALLLGAALALLWPPLAAPLLWWADAWLALLLRVLEVLLRVPGAVAETAVPWPAVLLAAVGVLLLLLPRVRHVIPWAVLACVPLALPSAPRLAEGDFRAEMLDVGQGLAVLVQTRGHVLLYDAGPAWQDGFDSGSAVVLPALRRQRLRSVDRILVSHEHMDHRGGVAAVAAGLPVREILSRRGHLHPDEEPCEAGLRWQWDGVEFRVLHPPPHWDDGNAASCVLAVQGRHGRLLLTGDLEGLGEAVLVHSAPEELDTDVLLVPHHGASGVLARGLLEAAGPAVAWVSSGFDNRFGHPAPDVRARLDARCIPLLDTAERGALWLETGPGGIRLGPGSRVERRRFWQPRVPAAPTLPAECPEHDSGAPLPLRPSDADVE
jgi:competence protein ComEC